MTISHATNRYLIPPETNAQFRYLSSAQGGGATVTGLRRKNRASFITIIDNMSCIIRNTAICYISES